MSAIVHVFEAEPVPCVHPVGNPATQSVLNGIAVKVIEVLCVAVLVCGQAGVPPIVQEVMAAPLVYAALTAFAALPPVLVPVTINCKVVGVGAMTVMARAVENVSAPELSVAFEVREYDPVGTFVQENV